MVLFKKAIRTILEHKAHYIGSMLLLLISSMIFITMNLTSINLGNMFQKFSEQDALSNAEFPIDADIDAVASGRRFAAKAESDGTTDCEVKSGQALRVFSAMNEVNVPAVQEGKLPGSLEALLNRPFAQASEYQAGDKTTVAGRKFTISGYAFLPNHIYVIQSKEGMMNDPNTFGIIVMGEEDFEALPGKNRVYAVRFDNGENIKAQEALVRNALHSQGIQTTNW